MTLLRNTCFAIKIKLYFLLVFLLPLCTRTAASVVNSAPAFKSQLSQDKAVASVIRKVLQSGLETKKFHFPKSVLRLYSRSEFQPIWITPEKDILKTWEALLILDCVLQFGLNHADYHPNDLLYSTMHDILEKPSKVNAGQKAWFDMLLSDALITIMNHLHFGKLNPVFTPAKLDQGEVQGFCAEDILLDALRQPDFMAAVLNVQPKLREYVLMQDYMKLIKCQYADDCYETPEGLVRKLAINMERLRWEAIQEATFIQVNIPSYTLKLQLPDTSYLFKVVLGRPSSPTPVLHRSVSRFSTVVRPVADQVYGGVFFKFQNTFGIYINDALEQQLFEPEMRALSPGYIQVQQGEKLAKILLNVDGQMQKYDLLHQAIVDAQQKTFNLKRPIPLKITYLTCAIDENGIVEYDDIYKMDKALELAFYGWGNLPMQKQKKYK
ncbi:hypothetical protein QG516_25340 [Pedobacter gandavensis]|uniref:hypothetical protein n=1 Tax=Pedobacter gandavensis TaxID=2679963 RepID=UPI002478ED6F|nr:hypothetical protein [Pedobacter gandavensis]WGQ09841.1 hypothetical protein QG516_25340 [Pedobacter gandavensis]